MRYLAAMFAELIHFARHAPRLAIDTVRKDEVAMFDDLMAEAEKHGAAERRAALLDGLQGRILELGCGTGLTFSHYPAHLRVDAVEPYELFLDKARERALIAAAPIEVHRAYGEQMPFADAAFDGAVIALVLCSVRSVQDVLVEVGRVLKPGAPLRLIEHVISDRPVAAALMHAADPIWHRLNGGICHMNRRVLPELEAAGFVIEHVEPFSLFSPGLPAFPFQSIRATAP